MGEATATGAAAVVVASTFSRAGVVVVVVVVVATATATATATALRSSLRARARRCRCRGARRRRRRRRRRRCVPLPLRGHAETESRTTTREALRSGSGQEGERRFGGLAAVDSNSKNCGGKNRRGQCPHRARGHHEVTEVHATSAGPNGRRPSNGQRITPQSGNGSRRLESRAGSRGSRGNRGAAPRHHRLGSRKRPLRGRTWRASHRR